MAKRSEYQPPKDYNEAIRRLAGRKKVFLPDGKVIMDYGMLVSINHRCEAVIIVDQGRVVTTYWKDGAVEHAE